jgi:hypothetical protein
MARSSLVKIRNLDPEVISFIKGNSSAGELPYIRRDDLAPYFNKNTDLVNYDMIDKDTKEKISEITIDKIRKTDTYRRNTVPIEMKDLSSELRLRLSDVQGGGPIEIPQEIKDDIAALKTLSNQNKITSNEALEKTVENRKLIDELSLKSENNSTKLNEKINANSVDIANLKALKDSISQLTSDGRIDKIIELVNRMTELNNILNRINQVENSNKEIKEMFGSFSKRGGQVGDIVYLRENDMLGTRAPLSFWAIVYSQEEVDEAKTAKNDFILNYIDNKLYIGTQDSNDPSIYTYSMVKNALNKEAYLSTFIVDTKSGVVYMNNNGTLLSLGQQKRQMTKDIKIAADDKIEVNIRNALNSDLRMLILDEETGSRTKDLYINGEGFLSVAYDTNKVTILNDGNFEAKVRLIYKE